VTTRLPRAKTAALAMASDGSLIINLAEFSDDVRPEALVRLGRKLRLPLFLGVVVPRATASRRRKMIEDAAADVAGRLGGELSARASGRSSVPKASTSRGQRAGRAPRPRGQPP
jgi:hypothetical protein